MRSTKSRIVVAFATAILLFSAFIVTPVTNKAHAQVKPKAFILVPGILTSSSSTDPKSIPGNGFWGNVYTTLKGAYPDAIFYEYSYNGFGTSYGKLDTIRSLDSDVSSLQGYMNNSALSGRDIYLVGHSKGGAVAALYGAAYYFDSLYQFTYNARLAGVITFDSPLNGLNPNDPQSTCFSNFLTQAGISTNSFVMQDLAPGSFSIKSIQAAASSTNFLSIGSKDDCFITTTDPASPNSDTYMHGGDNIPVHSGGDHNIFFVSPNAHTTVLSDSSAMASMVSHINSWASTVSGGSTPTPTPPTGGSGGSGGGTNPTPTPTPQPTPQPSDGVKVCHGANYGSPCTVFTDTGSAQSLGARSHDQDSVQFLGSYANAYDAVFCLRDGCPSNDSEIMHDDPDFSKRLVQNQYVAIKLVKLPPPQPTPNSGFVVYSDTNYGGNHGTFTYTNHDFCINLDQMAGHNKSVQYIGDYVGGYSAVMYHDTNCGTYLARYDDSKSDIGWGLYNQFSSMRLEKHVPPEKGVFQGSWNSPDDTATTQKGGIVHYSAHVTTTSGTLGRVEFRAVKDGTWHVSCIGTQSGNDYSCDWNPASAGYGDNSTFGIAFDVYDSLGNETSNLQPDRHITYAPTPPPTPAQGTWNSPQDNFTVVKGGTLHFSVTATGSAVAKLVIRGTWGTTPWTTLCSFSATTSHVYECDWNPGSSNVADNSSLRVAFDAYRADGWKILSSPAGDRVGMYAPPVQQPTPTPTPPAKDATQVSPANGSVLPIGTTETDVTYQGTGSFTIHVWDLTTHYDVWTAGIATTTYHLTGLQAGASYNWQILGSTATWTDTWTFSIAKAAPTPTPSPSPTPTPIPPQGTWNSPNDNFTVVKNGTLHFSANVTGSAVTKVNFRATWNSTPWVDDLCSLAVNNSHVYTCDWNIAARGVPDNTFVRTAFDAYDANGTKILSSPAGDRVGTYAPPTPTPSPTPPTVKSGGFTTIEGQTTTGTISATSVSGKKLTLTASNLPKFVTFKDNGNGTGIFTAKPVIGNAGNYSFTVTAGDGSLSGKGTVTIKVNSAPLPKPTVSWDMPMTMTATAGKAYTFKVKANPGKGDSIFIVDFFLQGGKYKILSACDQNKKDKNGDYSCSWNFKDYNGKKIAPGNYTIYAWVDTTKNQTVQSRLLKVTVR